MSIRYSVRRGLAMLSSQLKRGTPEYRIQPQLDWDFLLDPANISTISDNIQKRKSAGNIREVHRLKVLIDKSPTHRQKFMQQASLIPNMTSDKTPIGGLESCEVIYTTPSQSSYQTAKQNESSSFLSVAKELGLIVHGSGAVPNLAAGQRSYSLIGDLAALQRALISYTIDKLKQKGWEYVSVPDLIPAQIIEGCGFVTTGNQNQVFRMRDDEPGNLCLAGTGEMPLAGLLADSKVSAFPRKLCTVSTCYRAEEAKNKVDRDFYRLYEFTKVEMFALTTAMNSDAMLSEIVATQSELFSELGLEFRVVAMSSEELGAPAYEKIDIEAWMCNKQHWGEISSASNCTDYQTRRLGITSDQGFPHTVNGTACAVPRMLISLIEQNQSGFSAKLPKVLHQYMRNIKLSSNLDTKKRREIRSRNKFPIQ